MESTGKDRLASLFPNLNQCGFEITSPATRTYNCIAWAAGLTDVWMWPDSFDLYFWPENAPREATIAAFVKAFSDFGYEICDSEEQNAVQEKIAIYSVFGEPKHAARQLPDGRWSSKCGKLEDISHDVHGFEESSYGTVCVVLARQRQHK